MPTTEARKPNGQFVKAAGKPSVALVKTQPQVTYITTQKAPANRRRNTGSQEGGTVAAALGGGVLGGVATALMAFAGLSPTWATVITSLAGVVGIWGLRGKGRLAAIATTGVGIATGVTLGIQNFAQKRAAQGLAGALAAGGAPRQGARNAGGTPDIATSWAQVEQRRRDVEEAAAQVAAARAAHVADVRAWEQAANARQGAGAGGGR